MATITTTAPVASEGTHTSYMDWPAVFAGIALASAVSIVLLTFGAAIGLSFARVGTADGMSWGWGLGAALFLIWAQVSSFMAGAYLTGRMRRRFFDATEHESDVRDGAHGLVVWAGAIVLGSFIAASGLGALANAVGSAVGTATVAASNAGEGEISFDPNAYFADLLLRTDTPQEGTDSRAEVTRILLQAGTDAVSPEDREYLATVVARETGLPETEATQRVDTVLTQVDQAKAQAAEAAETARRVGILAAFLATASLLVGAAAAYWAAGAGGNHRDRSAEFAFIFRRT